MQIQQTPIRSITPFSGNAKTHPPEQISKLAKEISEIGFTQPIVLDGTNTIVVGHGRYMAAKKLGLENVPCVFLPHDLPEERVRAIRLFDNKIAETKWDSDLLLSELDWFTTQDIPLEITGFTVEEFASLMDVNDKPEKQPIDANDIEEFCMFVTCDNEEQLQQLFDELQQRGLKVKLT